MGSQPRRGRNTDDRMNLRRPRPLTDAEERVWMDAVKRDYYRYLATVRVLHRRRVEGNHVRQAERVLYALSRLIEEIARSHL